MRNNHDQIIDDHIYIDANRGPCHILSTSPRRQCKRLQQAQQTKIYKPITFKKKKKIYKTNRPNHAFYISLFKNHETQ